MSAIFGIFRTYARRRFYYKIYYKVCTLHREMAGRYLMHTRIESSWSSCPSGGTFPRKSWTLFPFIAGAGAGWWVGLTITNNAHLYLKFIAEGLRLVSAWVGLFGRIGVQVGTHFWSQSLILTTDASPSVSCTTVTGYDVITHLD